MHNCSLINNLTQSARPRRTYCLPARSSQAVATISRLRQTMAGDQADSGTGPSPLANLMKKMEDCSRPACADTASALSAALGRVETKKPDALTEGLDWRVDLPCPPVSGVLGKSSWNLIHSMAAWYPDNPSTEDKKLMTNFMEALARFYPCTYCAADFQNNLKQSPVRVKTREELCVWLCEQHNLVNQKLDKKPFPCDIQNLDKRWRESSDPRCAP